MQNNKMKLEILSLSENESFARSVIGCFALKLNPTISQLDDIKTAVSEAVTNSIVHGYQDCVGTITIEAYIENDTLHINVIDNGKGIEDIKRALEPFYSTKADEERSGMGFTIMQTFMDSVEIKSSINNGTSVYMTKKICGDYKENNA